MIKLPETFEAHNDEEFLKFERITAPSCGRPDLHAFLLLDRLLPGKRDIISAAEHDQIWLDVNVEKLAEVATENDVIELVRCGVMYDDHTDSLFMFA